jgi:serine phosphatase RsbU (regulator of sigma subunit)
MKASKNRRESRSGADLELRAASGPTAVSFRLRQPSPATIGRRSENALQLNDPAVSRDHAKFCFRPAHGVGDGIEGEWLLEDVGSTHGTWLNGVRLKCNRQYHVRANDLVVIGPWTLLVADRSAVSRPGTSLATVNDAALVGTVVSRFEPSEEERMTHQGLKLLQECSECIHGARTEAALVEAVLNAAVAGSEFTRAVFLRPMTHEEQVEIIACKGDDPAGARAPRLSRTLIREAAAGTPARLQRDTSGEHGASHQGGAEHVVALCVPVMVESTLAGFIYLDSPSNDPERKQPETATADFPLALARLAAMGMANLMRIDIEQRQARMEAKLHAAAEAQQWLLPQRTGQVGPFKYVGETRQGRYIGGDFFDVIPLENERLAVVVGDVRGKGIPVSVLVSASQGFLHASLLEHEDPALAVVAVNRFYHSRISHSRSLRLWVGIFDAKQRILAYVSAAHRCAMTVSRNGESELMPSGENPAAGMKPEVKYQAQSASLAPGGRILILSDGFIEQRAGVPQTEQNDDSATSDGEQGPERFGLSGVQECLHHIPAGEDEIAKLFSALEQHAGTNILDDDATAVMIRW